MTRILHGSFLPGPQRFVCWGEQEQTAPRKKGRQPKRVRHPFAMSSQQMAEWASGLVSGLEVTPTVQTIWLPSTPEGSARRPQPSPEFLATGAVEPLADVALSLRAWQIDAISLPTMDAVDLLLTISGNAVAQAGSDLLFWRSAALYALSLVTAQEVLPCLERIGFQLRAFWKADPRQPDQFIALVKLMPPVCRAMEADPDAAATSASLLEAFVNAVTDNTIRQAAQSAQWRPPATPGGKWLAALTGDDPLVTIKGADADRLYKDWQTWTGQAGVAGNAAFKIALRLETPDDYHANWRITYLLQATDDPSLIIPAGQVWRGDSADYLRQRFDQPQERLLTGLGFAARLFPPINGSLRNVAPEYAGLDVNQAYVFLREVAPLLQQSGFHVLLPRWWSGRSAAVSVKAKLKGSKVTGKSLLTLDTLVNYEWQVKLGGQPISREEFEALAALKQPLVMLRGQWVALDEGQVTQALKFFDERSGQTTLEEALRLGLGGEDGATTDGIRVEGTDATGWLKALLKSLKQPDQIEPVPIPAGLHVQLRPYQERGYAWLVFLRRHGLGACLADDMGLGKTAQAITLLLHARYKAKVKTPALVVCPTSVVGNWRRELQRFAPDLTVLIHQGAERSSGGDFAKQVLKHDVVITSYPLLARDRDTLTAVEWSAAILDEAQSIKNASTKQAQAARALRASSRFALTGTPVENRLSELWSIFAFLNPGYLGSETSFRKQFAGPIERVNDARAIRQLKQLTGPFILRRLKTDPKIISDLPEKLEMKVYCNLTTEQGTLYEAVVKDVLEQVEEADAEGNNMARRGLVLSMLLKLKQICNHPAQFLKDGSELAGRSGKLARLTEMLEEVYAEDDRALVFTQFAEMGELLRQHLRDVFYDEPLWLHGGTPVKERESMIARFQATRGPTVFLLSLKAGGLGLTLTRANHVFHFDRWWNPAVENQATDRAFRIGQMRNVQVHKFICGGTLEDKIDEMIESKKALAESIIGADEDWLTELSTGDLRDLVALRSGEVA